MSDNQERLERLQEKMNSFLLRQGELQQEVQLLRAELRSLKVKESLKPREPKEELPVVDPVPLQEEKYPVELEMEALETPQIFESPETSEERNEPRILKSPVNWEKLIGENIINKIGIAITVLGVGIGANYAIENNLISPTARIILGYLVGLGLLGFAMKLKEKYLHFSSVLLSGAMASMYLVTYAAYTFYDLIPQLVTFGIMVAFTVFTVYASMKYDREIIALLGLVGGYAVPFLLSDNSGNVVILFSYMLLINTGVLVVAFKKYWKALYYSAFAITWGIFLFWFALQRNYSDDIFIALAFSTAYFLLFYTAFLAYKLLRKEEFSSFDISKILTNSFFYFGIGYIALSSDYEEYQGLFTLFNALVHFGVSLVVFNRKLATKALQNFISGIVLIFLTLTIPIQLQGKWITIAWSLEGLLLFWLSRTKSTSIFERISYPVMILAFLSLLMDWQAYAWVYDTKELIPIFNTLFLTSALFCASFFGIAFFSRKHPESTFLLSTSSLNNVLHIGVPAILIFSIYMTFRLEIGAFFDSLETKTSVKINSSTSSFTDTYPNPAIVSFRSIWLLIYTLGFVSLAAVFNLGKFKSERAKEVNLVVSLMTLFFFFSAIIFEVRELRELYLGVIESEYFSQGIFNILIRYLLFAFVGFNLFTIKKQLKGAPKEEKLAIWFEGLLVFTVIYILSAELVQWLDIFGFENSYKLGLSILWGLSSLTLISLGIFKKKSHLRLGAMFIFSVTLAKLFLYDISHLSTISKTIVFVSLGLLLLVISFLYNKFKHRLFEDEPK